MVLDPAHRNGPANPARLPIELITAIPAAAAAPACDEPGPRFVGTGADDLGDVIDREAATS
jgi:hypothetical protein